MLLESNSYTLLFCVWQNMPFPTMEFFRSNKDSSFLNQERKGIQPMPMFGTIVNQELVNILRNFF